MNCVFCDIGEERAPATIVESHVVWFAIEPLKPHVPGHVLFIPRHHVVSASESPRIAGVLFEAAATFARRYPAFNLLTSVGENATQTVEHLHVHVIPRGPDDGIPADWPWMREGMS